MVKKATVKPRVPRVPKEPVVSPDPLTINEILADLRGFGIEDTEELISLNIGGKTVSLRLSNIPSEWEVRSLIASEGMKGHAWVIQIKCEILSKAISWINGVSLRDDASMFVLNPITGEEGNIRPVLRDMLRGWGQEAVNVLWKVLMVHCQGLEDRLFKSLPDASIMTEVEKRYMDNAIEELIAINRDALKEQVQAIVTPMGDEG